MATNQYFDHYHAANEQNLIEDLVIESIQTTGLDVAYIPRTQVDIDVLYKEDPSNVFSSHKKIEMYPAFVDGFDGDGEMFSRFGLDIKSTATFIVSRKRFGEEFPEFIRPREGDLIFMPITNAVLEIKFVDHESPFFEKGKQYVYEVKLETFDFSHEEIVTGDPDIDSILGNLDVPLQDTEVEEYGVNDEVQAETDPDIVFDPSNPFGVR